MSRAFQASASPLTLIKPYVTAEHGSVPGRSFIHRKSYSERSTVCVLFTGGAVHLDSHRHRAQRVSGSQHGSNMELKSGIKLEIMGLINNLRPAVEKNETI